MDFCIMLFVDGTRRVFMYFHINEAKHLVIDHWDSGVECSMIQRLLTVGQLTGSAPISSTIHEKSELKEFGFFYLSPIF